MIKKRKREHAPLAPNSLKSTHLRPGATVPANTTLGGELWGFANPPAEGGRTKHLLFLKLRLPREPDDDNPFLPGDKVLKYKVRCGFSVDYPIDNARVSERLKAILEDRKPVELDVGGAKVVTWQSGQPIDVTLECDGPIRLKRDGVEEELMGRESTGRQETPAWMASPTPAPYIPLAPAPAPAMPAAPKAAPTVVPTSKLKPVSAFFPFPALRPAPAAPIVTPSAAEPYRPVKKTRVDLSEHTSSANLPPVGAMAKDDLPPDMPPSSIELSSSGWPSVQSQSQPTAEAPDMDLEELPESAEVEGFALIADDATPAVHRTTAADEEGGGLPAAKDAADASMDVDAISARMSTRSSPSPSPKKAAQPLVGAARMEQIKARRIKEAQTAIAAQEEAERTKEAKRAAGNVKAATPPRKISPVKSTAAQTTASAPLRQRDEEIPHDHASAKALAAQEAKQAEMRERRKAEEARVRREALERAARQEEEARVAMQAGDALRRGWNAGDTRYTVLKDIRVGMKANIVGIVLEVTGQKQVKTGDWITNVVVTDPSTYDGAAGEDFLVTCFKGKADQLPGVQRGDAILLRLVTVTMYNNKPKGQIYKEHAVGWVSIDNGKLKGDMDLISPKISKAEIDRLKALEAWWKAGAGGHHDPSDHAMVQLGPRRSTSPVKPGMGGFRGLVTLAEVGPNEFFRAAFKILAVVSGKGHFWAELYITDGTVSPHLTRNFHGVSCEGLPPNGLWCLGIKDKPPRDEEPCFQEGNYLKMNNIRSKVYQDALELNWSEKVTIAQEEAGWNRRKVTVLDKSSEEARVIEGRLRALKRGEVHIPDPMPPSRSASPVKAAAPPPAPTVTPSGQEPRAPSENVPLATHLSTTYLNPISHPLSTIPQIISNGTLPNRFRLHARVDRLIPRAGDGYVQKHCKKCRRAFTSPHCQSCNDTSLASAEYRYRLIALLSHPSEATRLPVLVSDDEAAAFLPALPPVSSSTNPNDHRKIAQRLKGCCAGAEEVLMGAKMDGERVRPVIEWSVESWVATEHRGKRKAKVGMEREEGVVVWRACGMVAR